jgi:GDP-4-dehydro-6-deoxy-D-mannose reductase
MSLKKVLISGCSGFLADFLIREFPKNEYSVYGITEVNGFVDKRIKVFNVDIREKSKIDNIIKSINPDIVFHLAAISNVGFSWKDPALTYDVNFIGSSNLLESLRKYSPKARVLLMSSAEVYKVEDGKIITETSPVEISNPYALSKYSMELLGNLYQRSYGISVFTVRSFNFTGPGQNKDFVVSDFSFQIASIEKGISAPIIRVGNLSAKRDFSDVRDIARYLRIIQDKADSGDIINICSGYSYSIKELLDILLGMSKVKIKVEVDRKKFRVLDSPVLSCNNNFIKNRFNLKPMYSIKQTLKDSLDFWREKIG